jgi:hypothetical protein
MTMMARFALLAAAASLSACAGGDAEEQLRRLIDAAEAAAESRDTGHFRSLISPDYRDARGNDRDAVINLLRAYFLTHQSIEVVTRIEEVVLDGSDAADIALGVALLGFRGRASGESLLDSVRGDLERLELELVLEGGDWRIVGATWSDARR